MKPVVKVLLVVLIVLVVVHILKYWMAREDNTETYIPWIHQEFETVPPAAFAVTPSALTISDALTAEPTIPPAFATLPSAVPTVVPTVVPTTRPMIAASARPVLVSTARPAVRPA